MKAPVGLLSDRTVLRSKMEGPRPDKFAFAKRSKREFAYGRRNRLILQEEKNRKFPLGNSLLYISLLSVVLIARFTSSAILNDRFAICNLRLLSTNQIVNCDGGVRPIQGRTLFLWLFLPSRKFALPLP